MRYQNSDTRKGEFTISDEQLKKEHEIAKIPFDYAENFNLFRETEDADANVTYEFTNDVQITIKKRVLESGSEKIFAGGTSDDETLTTNIPNVLDVDLQEYIDTYYSFAEKTLNMYREITADVYLTINDYNKIDFEEPIWIKNWGWFMLEPVTYRENGLSTVTLIHINKSSFVPDIAGDGDYNDLDYNENDYYL